jgi:hypothetical protein
MPELEIKVEVLKSIQDQHHEQLAEVRHDLKSIRENVAAINTKLASVIWCPKPGTCVALEAVSEIHASRLRSLEDSRLQATTSGRVLMWLVCGTGLLSAIIGAIIAKLI